MSSSNPGLHVFYANQVEILAAQLNPAGPIAPRELNPAIPPALEKVVLRCLEREPARRYPFTSVLLHDVQSALYV